MKPFSLTQMCDRLVSSSSIVLLHIAFNHELLYSPQLNSYTHHLSSYAHHLCYYTHHLSFYTHHWSSCMGHLSSNFILNHVSFKDHHKKPGKPSLYSGDTFGLPTAELSNAADRRDNTELDISMVFKMA